jgi:asparagine synthase (glutamine-hydrolysing)
MCGIAGVYAYHYAANQVDRAELRRIRDHMAARGPDGLGEWYSQDERVGFGHRRLAILDLSDRGAQPMSSVDGKLVVTFNGEIYNYRQLRTEMEARGRMFRTQTDTEVLLHLYAEKGEALVDDLRGMFAFGLWDAEKNALLLARDPYGIKPLYYADDGWTLRFASQVKALLAGNKVSRDPEPAGWVGFCLFGSVPEPFTTYQEIRALPAGSTLWVDRVGTREAKQYFSIAGTYCSAEVARLTDDDEDLRVREALLESVRHHLVADVPVGAFLSSGIDSGALVGLMCDAGQQDVQTVTLAFEEFRGTSEDEAPIAQEVAAKYGTCHTTRFVTEREFRDDLPKILEAMDQPTIDGLNTWFVSKAARELGLKVAISGLGGDELFGGYPSYRDMPRWVRLLAVPGRIPWLGDLARQLLSGFDQFTHLIGPKSAGLLKYGGTYAGAYLLRRGLFMPWELDSIIGAETTRLGLRRLKPLHHIEAQLRPEPKADFCKVAALESSLYMRNQLLRDTDWSSMAHSLEVRVPLVDAKLLRDLAGITPKQASRSKRPLANSPRISLPPKVVDRAKTGFTTPIQQWLQRDKSIQKWRQVPALAVEPCAWARRWAFQVAAA